MMGLPDGWTRVDGVTRAQRLAICGRAVVPQQAAAAYVALAHRRVDRAA